MGMILSNSVHLPSSGLVDEPVNSTIAAPAIDSILSSPMASLTSCNNRVKLCLSSGLAFIIPPPPTGYSQSRSIPCKPNWSIISLPDRANLFFLLPVAAASENPLAPHPPTDNIS